MISLYALFRAHAGLGMVPQHAWRVVRQLMASASSSADGVSAAGAADVAAGATAEETPASKDPRRFRVVLGCRVQMSVSF